MFQRLQAFISVYQTRSFTQTAADLFISQPSVSAHIKNLEQDLAVTLFERGKRQAVQPTADADLFYPQAQKLLRDWQQTQLFFSRSQTQPLITLGASHFSALTFVPKLIPTLAELPVTLNVQMLNSQALIQQVIQGKMDFAFVEQAVTATSISSMQLTHDQLVLAGSGDTWLVREDGASAYEHTKRYFSQYGLPEKVMTIQSTDIILALLQQGFGRSIVSQHLLDKSVPFEPLDVSFQRPVTLIWREPLSDTAQTILNVIKKA
ncbi:MAG TPA: LysR family transcriptional regulator [Lactobacillaceae bacterium]|jgi:DNA-binding transcriptional LysR family regulator